MVRRAAADERYAARGVSASIEDVHAAIKKVDKGLFPKAFCKIVEDIAGDEAYCTCMHADGAGTKSSLAYAYWRETGDLSVWRGIAQDSIVMNTDDLLCVGCVDNIFVSSTIGRNKALIPGEVLSALINGTEEVLETLREFGVGVKSTGGGKMGTGREGRGYGAAASTPPFLGQASGQASCCLTAGGDPKVPLIQLGPLPQLVRS